MMDKLRLFSLIALIISIMGIVYALIFKTPAWIVYLISIFLIPVFLLAIGLLCMAKPIKDEEEERVFEPFIGY